MLRAALFALTVIVAAVAGVRAQGISQDLTEEFFGGGPNVLPDPAGGDFMIRPGQDPIEDQQDDIWGEQTDESGVEQTFGPPLAGPTGAEPIGPPLAGPTGAEPIGPRLATPTIEEPDEDEGRDRRPEPADPFAATGIRLGSFIIRPAIEVGVSATDNVTGGTDEQSATGLIVAPELTVRSQDDRHEFGADLRAAGVFYEQSEFDDREALVRVFGRYELTSRTTLEGEATYDYNLEGFTDLNTPEGAAERPARQSMDAALGVTQRFGRIGVGVRGTVDRSVYEDVPLVGGGVDVRDELDNTATGLRLRTSYEISPALTPFADVAAGRRDFDREVDDNGFARSSVWGELRGGLLFDLGPKLSGEVALGFLHEDIEDEQLDDIDAVTAAAAILWSPRRLTEIRLDFTTYTSPTSNPDYAATLLYSGFLTATHRVGARTRLEAGLGLDYETPIGADWRDVTFTGFAGASYSFSRMASVTARYTYEQTESTLPGGDESANTVTVRLRLQR